MCVVTNAQIIRRRKLLENECFFFHNKQNYDV